MGLFDSPKPKITKEEYKHLRNELYAQGFSSKELAYVDELIEPHLEDASRQDSRLGIDETEVKEIEEEATKPDPRHIYTVKLSPQKVEVLKKS